MSGVHSQEELRSAIRRTRFLSLSSCFAIGPILTTSFNGFRNPSTGTSTASRLSRRLIVANSIALPAWEREYERDRGLVGTSYETATVEDVTPVGDGFLRISVDTAVTCTSQTYVSEGQFLFLKPWGDEDGAIEPCCFTMPPGEETMMEFFVPEVSPVGAAALAGEMLEVSEVMGEGFGPHLQSKDFKDASCVMAVCIEQFCSPSILALRNEKRQCTIFVIAEKEGPFGSSLQEWITDGTGNRRVLCYPDETSLVEAFQAQLEQESSAAILLSADKNLCHRTEDAVHRLNDGRRLYMFAP